MNYSFRYLVLEKHFQKFVGIVASVGSRILLLVREILPKQDLGICNQIRRIYSQSIV